MPRIAFVTNLPTHYRRPLFEELARRFDIDFYFTSRGRERYWPKEHTISHSNLHVRGSGSRASLWRLAHEPYACVVASLTGRLSLLIVLGAARVRRVPFVVWVGIWEHPSTLFHRISRPFVKWLYRRADAVLVYGSHVAAFIAHEAGRTTGVCIVPQAVDNDRFRTPPPDEQIAAARGAFPAGALIALYIGRVEPEKGLETLVSALPQAPAWHLSVVGAGSNVAALRELARDLGCGHRVRFKGYVRQEELAAHLYACDVLVLPSVSTPTFREPWGLVVNEAMNAGRPVLVTDAVGAAAGGLVVDGETGLVVRQGRADEIAAALHRLGDAGRRLTLGAAGRERVQAWNYTAAADAIEATVREVSR